MASVAEIVDQIKGLNILEVSELVKELETAFGVTAAAPMAFAAAPAAGGAAPAAGGGEAAPVAEAKTEFDVILTDIGPNKINVIKAVRELTNLGLKEAKDLVEAAPKPVKEGVNKEEADAAQKKLVEAGAKADVK